MYDEEAPFRERTLTEQDAPAFEALEKPPRTIGGVFRRAN